MSAALATLNEAMEKAQRNGDEFWYPRMPNCFGWIHRELQDFEGARKYDEMGVEVSRHHHVLEAEANSLINLGIDYTHEGDEEKTVSAFYEVKDIFARDAWFRWRYNIRLQAATAEHWLKQGDLEKAGEFAERLRDTAKEHGVRKYIGVAHKLMGDVAVAKGKPERHYAAALGSREYLAPSLPGRRMRTLVG